MGVNTKDKRKIAGNISNLVSLQDITYKAR
jgi:hypothetical protein